MFTNSSSSQNCALAALMAISGVLAGCGSTERLAAVPATEISQTTILGITNARFFIDETAPIMLTEEFMRSYEREVIYYRGRGSLPPANFLALSGGGDNGAFGAGLLVGWSERGSRPTFKAVTGISTGALIAPFAFLGSEYDEALTDVFTKTDQQDIYEKRPVLAALGQDALADTKPLFNLITRYVDDQLIDKIAREYDKGRLLLIASTNLDAGKSVIWNIGAIAKSRHPDAAVLIRRILLASAAIPGMFPPVLFDVEVDGKKYQELHSDGGVVAQTFLYPPTISLRTMSAKGKLAGVSVPAVMARKRTAFLIRNGKLSEDWKEIEPKTLTIAGRAVSSLIDSNGVGDMYRIYGTTKRDGVDYNLAYIGRDFEVPYKDPFNREYMNKLFDYGKAKALTGNPWHKQPPGLVQ